MLAHGLVQPFLDKRAAGEHTNLFSRILRNMRVAENEITDQFVHAYTSMIPQNDHNRK